MSTDSAIQPFVSMRMHGAESPDGNHAALPGQAPAPELIHAARHEVQQLTKEIADLSRQEISAGEFFAEFLQRVTRALASGGGVVWLLDGHDELQAVTGIDPAQVGTIAPDASSSAPHDAMLRQVMLKRQPTALPPGSVAADSPGANATPYLLLLVPLQVNGEMAGVIEVQQRPHRGPATERGYLNYLVQTAELAESFLLRDRLRRLTQQRQWSEQLQRFLSEIHRELSADATAFAVVNEARRLSGVDRVTLALGVGRECRVHAVSGLDNLERRAEQVRSLSRLAACALKGGEPLWLDTGHRELAPQVERVWNHYVDISHVRRCAVFPLCPPHSSGDVSERSRPFGALIFEQLLEALPDEERDQRVRQLSQHSALALHNALRHEQIFLLPLWRMLGSLCEAVGGRHFTKSLAVAILMMAAIFTLVTVEADFTVPAHGKLQPVLRKTIFARLDGVVTRVPVAHGQMVQAGDILAEMRNTDLEVEITSLVGKQTATQQQLVSLQRTLLDDPRLDSVQQNRLSGELLQLKQTAQSIQRQLELVRQKEEQLVVRAEAPGQVVTWHVQDSLLLRPVQKGQALMTVVDPAAEWELELFVPERHIGHVLEMAEQAGEPLLISFLLSSEPNRSHTGRLTGIDPVAVTSEAYGDSVRIRVAIEKEGLAELRADATVTASVHCGRRSLGYAWFHEFFDTVQGRLMFWLSSQE